MVELEAEKFQMPYAELYVHLVWATKGRMGFLVGERVGVAEGVIRTICREHGVIVHAIGMVPDHVHVAVSMPPRLSVSELMRLVKGGSSHLLNSRGTPFGWQEEYGALSFGRRSLPGIVDYVMNQAAHHAGDDLWPTFEQMASTKPETISES